MKKLLNTAMLACALFLTFISCSKETDPQPGVAPTQPSPVIPSPIIPPTGVTVSSNDIDLSLTAYSSLPPTTLYTIKVNGTTLGEFKISTTPKMIWHLNLQSGLNTIYLYCSPVPDYIGTVHSSFLFNIDDHASVQNIAGGNEQIKSFSFYINVVN